MGVCVYGHVVNICALLVLFLEAEGAAEVTV